MAASLVPTRTGSNCLKSCLIGAKRSINNPTKTRRKTRVIIFRLCICTERTKSQSARAVGPAVRPWCRCRGVGTRSPLRTPRAAGRQRTPGSREGHSPLHCRHGRRPALCQGARGCAFGGAALRARPAPAQTRACALRVGVPGRQRRGPGSRLERLSLRACLSG